MRKIGFYLAFVLLIPPPAFAQMNAMSARPITTGEMDAFLQKQMQELGMPRSFDRCDQPRRGRLSPCAWRDQSGDQAAGRRTDGF